jgi:hypothetical protein
VLVAVAAVNVSGCTNEDYYRSANRSAELNTTANLDKVDTIKTSAVSRQPTFVLPIEASDENGNMNLLTTFADGGETRIIGRSDGDNGATEAIELTKERYNFTRQIEFTPTVDGQHTVNIRIRDDFGNVSVLEKNIYSFTNMRPKLKVGHYAQRNLTGDIYDNDKFIARKYSYLNRQQTIRRQQAGKRRERRGKGMA